MGAMSLLFSVHGRIGRSTYWLKFCLPYLAIYLLLLAADWRLGTVDPDEKTVGLRPVSSWRWRSTRRSWST